MKRVPTFESYANRGKDLLKESVDHYVRQGVFLKLKNESIADKLAAIVASSDDLFADGEVHYDLVEELEVDLRMLNTFVVAAKKARVRLNEELFYDDFHVTDEGLIETSSSIVARTLDDYFNVVTAESISKGMQRAKKLPAAKILDQMGVEYEMLTGMYLDAS